MKGKLDGLIDCLLLADKLKTWEPEQVSDNLKNYIKIAEGIKTQLLELKNTEGED